MHAIRISRRSNMPFSPKRRCGFMSAAWRFLFDEAIRFADAVKHKRNTVEVFVESLANHDILYVGNLTGFAAEVEKGVRAAVEFIKRVGKE